MLRYRVLGSVVLALALAPRAFSQQGDPNAGKGDSFASGSKEALAKTLLSVASMHDMEGGRWILVAAPGFWLGDLDGLQCGTNTAQVACRGTGTLHGWTFGTALKRELSRHWGIGVLAGASRQFGSVDLTNQNRFGSEISDAGFAGGIFKNMESTFVGVQVTFDPFSGPDGIRLPISFGPMLLDAGADFSHSFTNPNTSLPQTESFHTAQSGLGVFANVSLDIPLGKRLRAMPAILLGSIVGDEQKIDYIVDRNGTITHSTVDAFNDNILGSLNVALQYRPWSLTLNFTPPVGDQRTWAVYSLRWDRRL